MKTRDIVHSLGALSPELTIADAIKFYEEYDKLEKDGVLHSLNLNKELSK